MHLTSPRGARPEVTRCGLHTWVRTPAPVYEGGPSRSRCRSGVHFDSEAEGGPSETPQLWGSPCSDCSAAACPDTGEEGRRGGRGRGGSAWPPRQGLTFQDGTHVPHVLVAEGGESLHHADLPGKLLQETPHHEGRFAREDDLLRGNESIHCLGCVVQRPSRPPLPAPAEGRADPAMMLLGSPAETRQAPAAFRASQACVRSGTLRGRAAWPLEISEPAPHGGHVHVSVHAP